MTRRKWTKLRRQKPHLFGALPAFEDWTPGERKLMATVSKAQALATMTAWWLAQGYDRLNFQRPFQRFKPNDPQ